MDNEQNPAEPVLEKIRRTSKPKSDALASRARAQVLPVFRPKDAKVQATFGKLPASVSEADLNAVITVWREAMAATTMTYDLPSKKWIERPDHNTRIKAANMIAAYAEGLPIQRQIQLQGSFEDLGTRLAALQSSPTALKMLESLKAGAIDVQATVQQKGSEARKRTINERGTSLRAGNYQKRHDATESSGIGRNARACVQGWRSQVTYLGKPSGRKFIIPFLKGGGLHPLFVQDADSLQIGQNVVTGGPLPKHKSRSPNIVLLRETG